MTLCAILPLFLLPFIKYFENVKLLKKFKEEAFKNKLNIEKKEFWNKCLLGIDPVQKKLLFVQQRNDSFSVEYIDLLTIQDSQLIPVSVQSRKYRKSGSFLKRIDLQLTFTSQKEIKLLNLYDFRLNQYKKMELSHAEKWNNLIHKYLTPGSLHKGVA